MTTKQFKLWLVDNNYTITTLASRLGVSRQAISGYCKRESFPVTFTLALDTLKQQRLVKELS